MPGEKYPLEPARELRKHAVDEATEELASRTSALEKAREAFERAERAVKDHDERTARIRAREHERDEQGRTVAEMQQAQSYLGRRDGERAELAQRVEQARQQAREASEAVEAARAMLAEAHAEQNAVDRHHERWQRERRREAEARDEAEAEDVRAGRTEQAASGAARTVKD